MKKFLSLILSICIFVSMTACGALSDLFGESESASSKAVSTKISSVSSKQSIESLQNSSTKINSSAKSSINSSTTSKQSVESLQNSSTKINSSAKSSINSSTTSSSSSSSGVEGLLYPEFDEKYEYLDMFNEQILAYEQDSEKKGYCRIHFIDVGQGDCMLIELPDGKLMVIDAGDRSSEVENAIEQYFASLAVDEIDYLIGTHQDADHIGNMDAVFDNYDVLKVYRPYVLSTHANASNLPEGFNQGKTNAEGGKVSTTATYYNFLEMIVEEGSEWEFFNKDTHITGDYQFEQSTLQYDFDFLTPIAQIENIAYSDANDYSPIILFTYAGVDVLFTGDAENEVMNEYLDNYLNQHDIEILKVGHHGSYTSTNQAYITSLKPEYSVIQVGLGNSYAHPRQEIVDLLHQNNSTIFRNDRHGDIVLTICPDGSFFFQTEMRAGYQLVLNGESM